MDDKTKWPGDQLLSAVNDEPAQNALPTSFGEERLSRIGQYGALLLTPDFAPQELVGPLFEWFQRWKSAPVAAVCHCFNPAEITLLYAGRITHRNRKGRMHSAWLSPRLYGMGTSVLLILRSTGAASQLQEQIMRDKGISRYGEHPKDSLRGMSPIADRCLSLVHSPDDYEGFFHVVELVIGIDGAKRALEADREPIPADELKALLPKSDLAGESHPFDLILRLIQQGTALLLGDPRTNIPRRSLEELFEAAAEERIRLRSIDSPDLLEDETWISLSRLASRLADVTEQQIGGCNRIASWDRLRLDNARLELCRVMQEMCVKSSFAPKLSHYAIEVFRRNHLVLGPWDEHRLHVLAAFHGVDSPSDASPERRPVAYPTNSRQ